MSPSLLAQTAVAVRGPPVGGLQRSADPLTVGDTAPVSHRLRVTVDDHSRGPDADDHSRSSFR